jgi:hypothetical protein
LFSIFSYIVSKSNLLFYLFFYEFHVVGVGYDCLIHEYRLLTLGLQSANILSIIYTHIYFKYLNDVYVMQVQQLDVFVDQNHKQQQPLSNNEEATRAYRLFSNGKKDVESEIPGD